MFLGMEWYWWIVIVVAVAVSIPIKLKFMKWWGKRQKDKNAQQYGKWGDEQ